MIIDCNACLMNGTEACRDCVVTSVLRVDADPLELGDEEQAALGNLADGGLVAPLRLVPRRPDRDVASG
jgi:hypothetical protein